jgi:hypothetical protein
MHFTATDERYYEALRRLAVVLLALAGIADSAACRPWPIRSLLLWLLGRAEERACGFAVRAGTLPVEYAVHSRGGPRAIPATVHSGSASSIAQQQGEAARLAKTFRALAAVFFALSRRAPEWLRMARRHHLVRQFGNRRNAVRVARPSFTGRRLYADTS